MGAGIRGLVLLVVSVLAGGVMFNLLMLQDEGARRLAPPPVAVLPPRDAESAQTDAGKFIVLNAAQSLETTKALQNGLRGKGYDPGPVDGVAGLMTQAALMAFEFDNGLPLTAKVTPERVEMVVFGVPADARRSAYAPGGVPSAEAAGVIRTVQQSLAGVGYDVGAVDGALSARTSRAIKEFEIDHGLPESGRVSGRLLAELVRLADLGKIALGGR